jgi:glycosyltransferase involved in cell wall biosynthesis
MMFLRHTVKKISPDTVLSFGEIWNSFVLLALTGIKVPIYISDRCSPDKKFGLIHDFLRKILYVRSAGIIVQTQLAYEIFKKHFKGPAIKVIGNPVRNITSENNIKKENIILTVGRLIPSKNHNALIRSFVKLNIPDWKLIIIGGDALKMNLMMELKSLIEELSAKEKVILTGTISDVDTFYLKSKIFVFTSESEGFPNAIGEAMSAGLPVVAFDCTAGPSELVSDCENGFLVPLYDYEKLEQRLLLLIEDSELRKSLGRQARIDVKRYNVDDIGKEFFQFITSKC